MVKRYQEAYNFFKETYKYAISGGHSNSICTSLDRLSTTALTLGLNGESLHYAMQNLELAQKINTKSSRIDAFMNLANYYTKVADEKSAFYFLQQATQLKDSLAEENNLKQLNILGDMYNYGKQQQEIRKLENEKEEQLVSVN